MRRRRHRHASVLAAAGLLDGRPANRRAGLGAAAELRAHLHAPVGAAPTADRRTFRPPGLTS